MDKMKQIIALITTNRNLEIEINAEYTPFLRIIVQYMHGNPITTTRIGSAITSGSMDALIIDGLSRWGYQR